MATSKQELVNNSEQSRNISSNFIKQKKRPELTPRQIIPSEQSQSKPTASKQFLSFTLMYQFNNKGNCNKAE